jgi:hypothetical protein
MNTFFNILQILIKSEKIIYPNQNGTFDICFDLKYNEQLIYESLQIYGMMYSMVSKYKISKQTDGLLKIIWAKYQSLNTILNNIFNSNELKEKIFDIFSKSQKNYLALSRFAYIYRFKRAKIVVSDDLTLSPIDINKNTTFILLQNNSKYLFRINDLTTIIDNALGNAPNFFAEPLPVKNPWNNLHINNSSLYNIYFKLKESNRIMSTLFHLFFLDNLDKKIFILNHEPYIRESSIKKYVYNTPTKYIYSSVLKMLKSNHYSKHLSIDKDFPKELLVEIFRPFLYFYYIVNYGISETEKNYKYKIILNLKLRKFYEHNKLFGRKKIITQTFFKKIKNEVSFNTSHIKFNEIDISSNSLIDSITTLFLNSDFPRYLPNILESGNESNPRSPSHLRDNDNNDNDSNDNVSDSSNNSIAQTEDITNIVVGDSLEPSEEIFEHN